MARQTNIIKGYIPQLDGIRGLAIILVISFHYFRNIPLFSFGWSGVDLFFVLSGYLITSRLITLQEQKNSLKKFYINRALRILPLYYCTLILFYTGFTLLVKKTNLHLFDFYYKNWASFALFFQNWSLIYSNAPKETVLNHFWSLAVEEQFYIIWPFFLLNFWQKKFFFKLVFGIILLIIITRTFLYIQYPGIPDYKYFFCNTFCRMDAFFIGGCLFLFQKNHTTKAFKLYYYTALLLIVSGIYFTGNANANNPFVSTIGFTLIAIVFAGIIYAARTRSSKALSIIFNYRWLIFTGKISYGLYVFHWIVLTVLEPRIEKLLTTSAHVNSHTANGISLFTCLVITYGISVISYFYFELYFLQRKMR